MKLRRFGKAKDPINGERFLSSPHSKTYTELKKTRYQKTNNVILNGVHIQLDNNWLCLSNCQMAEKHLEMFNILIYPGNAN